MLASPRILRPTSPTTFTTAICVIGGNGAGREIPHNCLDWVGRSKYFPDVPTLAEQGFAEAQVTPWFGIVVPVGTPEPIVDRIGKALEAALATSAVREKLDVAGCAARSAPRAQFADIIKSDVALWAKVVKDAGIPPD